MAEDDSTVLHDLVRTAEASRLRRRGAMRIDYHRRGHGDPHPHTSFITVTEPTLLSWDDDDDEEYAEEEEGYVPSLLRTRTRPRLGRRLEYKYTLFCGGDVSPPPPPPPPPYKPSVLPILPSSRPIPTPQPSGCGTLLHVSAAPRANTHAQTHTWHAHRPGASASLVPLDPAYVPDPAALRIHRAPCGCARDAIACAVCGNVLGTRFVSCAVSSHSRLHAHLYTYVFLGTAVTSSPSYTPPPTHRTYEHQTQTYPPLLDRLITASPTPLSDDERAAYRASASASVYPYHYPASGYPYENIGPGLYDPDADEHEEPEWVEDPGSPDKAAEGALLVPER